MLTDDEWREFQSTPDQGYSHRHWVDTKIREAVEAARADQIEKDARVAEDAPGTDATGYYAGDHHAGYQEAQQHIAAAIRAQLNGGN